MFGCIALILLGVVLAPVVTAQICSDIDSNACALFVSAQPDYCSDETARRTCPRFCKLCPVECYNCNATVLDFHDCNTTMLCAEGEICMKKELKSYIDGHHEYEMTCQAKQLCDGGPGLSIPFGKREIESRDISIMCCADDLCNYPQVATAAPTAASTSAPGCPKDIVFLVDESSRSHDIQHNDIVSTISSIVSQLDIGRTANLVGLYGYDTMIRDHIDLDKYTDKHSLLTALQRTSLTSSHIGRGDTPDAIHFLVEHALQPADGDRTNYPDVVVIIGDANTMSSYAVSAADRRHLARDSQDVILVTLGGTSQYVRPLEHQLATDSHHIFHVPSVNNLAEKLLPLITQC